MWPSQGSKNVVASSERLGGIGARRDHDVESNTVRSFFEVGSRYKRSHITNPKLSERLKAFQRLGPHKRIDRGTFAWVITHFTCLVTQLLHSRGNKQQRKEWEKLSIEWGYEYNSVETSICPTRQGLSLLCTVKPCIIPRAAFA